METALAVRQNAAEYQEAVKNLGNWLSDQKPSSSAVTKEKKETLEAALLAKEMGNALVAKGRYEKALAAYTKSLALDPTQSLVYGNRALVWLKLECYAEAEKDATTALEKSPKNVKLLWRRGMARKELGKLKEAREDLKRALVLEPTHSQIQSQLSLVETLIAEIQPTVSPITQKKEEKIQVKRPVQRRLQIEEIGTAEENQKPDGKSLVPAFKSLLTKETLASPCSLLDFERDYQSIKGNASLWAAYVKMIPTASYQSLFKNAFETDHLSSFLQAISQDLIPSGNHNLAFSILDSLKNVERFSTARMFLSKQDKVMASQIFDCLEKELKEKPVAAFRSKFYKC